jgi:hypothetical protein
MDESSIVGTTKVAVPRWWSFGGAFLSPPRRTEIVRAIACSCGLTWPNERSYRDDTGRGVWADHLAAYPDHQWWPETDGYPDDRKPKA